MKLNSRAAEYAMDLFGIDKRHVRDIDFHFPLHGAAEVTIRRLLSADEEDHARRLLAGEHRDVILDGQHEHVRVTK